MTARDGDSAAQTIGTADHYGAFVTQR